MQGHMRKTPVWSGRERVGRGVQCLDHRLYWGFLGKARQARVNGLGVASLNNLHKMWAIGVVPRGCLQGARAG